MLLRSGGVDIFYIDESNDSHVYVVTAVAVPFLRESAGIWNIVWPDYLQAAKGWRRRIRDALNIPVSKELHGVKLASGRGRYLQGKFSFYRPKAGAAYREILRLADFLPNASVITVRAQRGGRALYGATRLEAAVHALFQRMRSQCEARRTNGFVFFDEGHEESPYPGKAGKRREPAAHRPLTWLSRIGRMRNTGNFIDGLRSICRPAAQCRGSGGARAGQPETFLSICSQRTRTIRFPSIATLRNSLI
jgi:hypothetical protein